VKNPDPSRHVSADALRQHFVDQCLKASASATCFFAKLIEHFRINANRANLEQLVPPSIAVRPA
jgi:hypothetical protein